MACLSASPFTTQTRISVRVARNAIAWKYRAPARLRNQNSKIRVPVRSYRLSSLCTPWWTYTKCCRSLSNPLNTSTSLIFHTRWSNRDSLFAMCILCLGVPLTSLDLTDYVKITDEALRTIGQLTR